MLTLLLVLTAQARASCDQLLRVADLSSALGAVEGAYAAMDVSGFESSIQRRNQVLACQGEQLTRLDAAAFHRSVALDAYIDQDEVRVLQAFVSSLTAQPGYILPSSIALEGNPLYALYDRAKRIEPGPTEGFGTPRGTVAFVDGTRSDERPTDRPAIIQLIAEEGSVLWSGYVLHDAAVPSWDEFGVPASDEPDGDDPTVMVYPDLDDPYNTAANLPDAPVKKRRVSAPLLVGAGTAAVTSASLYVLSWNYNRQYNDLDNSNLTKSDLDSLRKKTNTTAVASAGVGAAAVGLGVAAVLWTRW